MTARVVSATWLLPVLFAVGSCLGLFAALTGDGWRDWLGWAGLAAPVASVAVAYSATGRRARTRRN